MKISTRWLARHVDTSGLSAKEIAEGLTLSTAEVEGVERFLPHLSDVVVGAVLERQKHPDADKLSLCKVDVGGPEILQIVCGAANVAAGQRVAVARVGTRLPGDVVIKKAKIRGVESQGMICSERELGLGDEHAGIWVLPPDLPLGRPVAESLGFDDWTIEIDNKSLTHRPDLWGHRGFATEVAAIFERKLVPLEVPEPGFGKGASFPVRIESPACSRYIAIPIDGVRTRRSPDWLRALLLAVGQRPIDLLVDVSNFVMLDLGQPNHVFDRGRLSPEGIVVRTARAGETTRTLDGVERKLTPDDLLICSGPEPVALAGVMGGEGSKVSPDTTSLLLEVASFHPATVRRTAQRLGLRTDSSARFEKSLSPTLPPLAASRFLALLRDLEPGLVLPAPPTDVGAWKDPARTIRLRGERVRKLLGIDIEDAEIASILRRLGLGVEPREGLFQVCVPSVRATKDLTIEQDLVEEIGRIHRYGRIPERTLVGEIRPLPRDESVERRLLARRLQDELGGGARFHETLSYSFLPDPLIEAVGLAAEPHVQVVNPVAEGSSRIRRHVLPSLLATLAENRRRRGEVRVFEIGKGYLPIAVGAVGAVGAAQPTEVHLCAFVWALPASKTRRFDADPVVRAKGAIENLLLGTGFGAPTWDAAAPGETAPWSAPGRCIVARLPGEPEPAATLCALDPIVARKLGLAGELASDVACAEISIDRLLEAPRKPPAYVPIPRLPSVEVDVAVAIPLDVRAAKVVEAIGKAGKGWVRSAAIFDVYQGANLGNERKSLAFHVTLAAEDRTLGDQDVAKFLERLARETESLGGELRRS